MLHPRRLAAPALILLVTIGFYWKLTLTGDYVWFDHPDMCYLEIPRLQSQARQVQAGRFPLWDPYIWAGQPLVGQTQPGPLYPLNLLLFLLPLRDGFLRFEFLNWYYVLIHFQAALFCYWMLRDLGRGRAASMLAGLAFSFGGFVGTAAWLDVLNGAVWTPLIFLFLFRAMRGFKPAASAALAGLFLGVAWLSGHHEIPMLVSFAAGAGWLYHLIRTSAQKGRIDWSGCRLAVLTLVIAGLVGAAQILPTYEFGRMALRWTGADDPLSWNERVPYTSPTIYSMPARGFLNTILPTPDRQADSTPFLGVVIVSMAALGLLSAWAEPKVRWMTVLAVAAGVYALGALTPVHGVLYSVVPMLGKTRVPVRAIHLYNFAIAVLAAYGVDQVLKGTQWGRRVAAVLAAFSALILGTVAVVVVARRQQVDDRMVLTGLVAGCLAAVVAAGSRGALSRPMVVLSAGTLLLAELTGVSTPTFTSRHDKDRNKFVRALLQHQDVADFLRSQRPPIRVVVNDQQIPANFGDWHGIEVLHSYTAGVTSNVMRHELHTKRTQSLFGVTHWVGSQPDRPDQTEEFAGSGGVKVFRNPDPMPRAWVVHQAGSVKQDGELRMMVQDAALEFHRQTVLLGEAPAMEQCAGEESVELRRRSSDRITLAARLNCRGMVILAETWFPGWRATVDGRPARLWEPYGVFRGVVVEAGQHTVEFRYRPLSVYLGAMLAALGLLVTIALVWRSRAAVAAFAGF